MRARGFTLLEVLIALSIFSLIGLGMGQVLKTVIETRDVAESHAGRLGEMQRALAVIERDLIQASSREIRDELGDTRPALVVGAEPYPLEFTRVGWRNPGNAPRSTLQRVAYSVADGDLLRHYWLVIDRAEDSEPVTQRLLSGVEDFRIDVVSEEGMITYLWPDETDGEEGRPGLPAKLQITLLDENLGEIVKLVDLVAAAKRGSPAGQGGAGPGGGEGGGEGGANGSAG